MPRTYTPTSNPGDTRTRCRRVRIDNPNGLGPVVRIGEELVILTHDNKEETLKETGEIVVPFDSAEDFAERNPLTDHPTGRVLNAGITMVAIYSWVRMQQEKRDAAHAAGNPAATPIQ